MKVDYFKGTSTLEEVNLRRSELMSEINKQYREKRDSVSSSSSGIKPLRFIHLNAVETPEVPLYAAFKIVTGSVPTNEVHMKSDSVFI